MQSTRIKIIDLLNARGEATVDELTLELALAPSTVRRHLDVLQRDGQVELRAVRRRAGRPHFAFSLTDAGQDALPQHHLRVTSSVIEELLALRPRDTRNKSGADVSALVFDRLLTRLLRSCRPRVSADDLAGRLAQSVSALAEQGFDFQITEREDAYVLSGRGCPCQRANCSHNQRLLSQLIGVRVEAAAVEVKPGFAAYFVRRQP